MTAITGTLTGATCISTDFGGTDSTPIECWFCTYDFAAYTDASDTADLTDVGAAITARAADGKTRTAQACVPAKAGRDTNGNATLFVADSGVAVDATTDDFQGDLAGTNHSGANRTASTGVGVIVYCSVA